ncbi:arsenic metallochaperone ArsD family protein [Listeria rustica]|uniref:Arsenic metallochaperone ArsD family protein n=1 Tax=Listeria rustica TaxID=2713503 RepID=A0A7W1T492_9LIST|nr:arsenic metallochaperone ArsD family protein [Listeria rustica]MBA3925092.1 arsenic metallochaperone ArsD family protein [Listeria rustica]
MEISYYCLQDNGNLELEIFKSIHNDSFSKASFEFTGEEIKTYLYIKSESEIPFLKNKLVHAELEENGSKILPIVIVNGTIVRRGGLLNPDELSELLGIGIAIQIDDC